MFPTLADKINDVTRIEIKSSENHDVILQKMDNGQWALQSADDYPAQFDKIKDAAWEDRMSYSKKIEQIFLEYLERREAQNIDEL